MQIGYMRVSKADGTQTLDLQKDALLAAGIEAQHIYEDLASGRKDDRLVSSPASRPSTRATPWLSGSLTASAVISAT